MSGQRRYSDQEVARILKRAAELSQAKSTGDLSTKELERIAAEAGIDPAAVRRAALEVARPERKGGGVGEALLGGPASLRYVFELEGELKEQDHEALLAAVQRNLDASGALTVAGRTFSWHATGPNRSITVQVAPVRGKSVVRIEERLGNLVAGIYGGVGGGVGGTVVPLAGVGAATLFGPVGAVVAVAVSMLGSYLGTRAIYAGVAKKRQRALDGLAEDLRATLEELLGPAKEASASALEEARERQELKAVPDAEPIRLPEARREGLEVGVAHERRAREG